MNQVKRLSAPYKIVSAISSGSADVTIGVPETPNAVFTVHGNLTVTGTTTTINTSDLSIADNFITLNSNVLSTDAPVLDAGVTVNRGSLPDVSIQWSEANKRWQLSNNGSTYSNIATTETGSFLSIVAEDPAPKLGGNLNVGSYDITSTGDVVITPTTTLIVEAPLKLAEVSTVPSVELGYGIIYADQTVGGGSGIFVASGASANEELVSKRKAVVFSLIF